MIPITNNLKKVMTDLAAGHINKKEAEDLIKGKISIPDKSEPQKKVLQEEHRTKKPKKGGRTQSHKHT